jgi:hypothetical protein
MHGLLDYWTIGLGPCSKIVHSVPLGLGGVAMLLYTCIIALVLVSLSFKCVLSLSCCGARFIKLKGAALSSCDLGTVLHCTPTDA